MYTYNKSFKTLPIEILPMYTHVNDCGFVFFRRKSCSFQEAEKKNHRFSHCRCHRGTERWL